MPKYEERDNISEPRINDRIRVSEVRLVGPAGEQVGIVKLEVAMRLAAEADLDLVEVAPDARPPVAKLMDYGKFKYESAQKARDARRNQAGTVLKEIRFRLKIDPHDYGTKRGHVERFLRQGDKVKVMIMFRGREQSRPEAGIRLLQRLADDIAELGVAEALPRQDGRNMTMVIAPLKKKVAPVREPRRQRSQDGSDQAGSTRPEPSADYSPDAVARLTADVSAEAEAAARAEAEAAARPSPERGPRRRSEGASARSGGDDSTGGRRGTSGSRGGARPGSPRTAPSGARTTTAKPGARIAADRAAADPASSAARTSTRVAAKPSAPVPTPKPPPITAKPAPPKVTAKPAAPKTTTKSTARPRPGRVKTSSSE